MRYERNIWQGLTRSQLAQIEDAQTHPHLKGLERQDVYRNLAAEFAHRTVALLVGNDLRGALDAAEISTACAKLAEKAQHDRARAAQAVLDERQRQLEDPNGRLVHVPGRRRRVRVFPGDDDPIRLQEIKQATLVLEQLRTEAIASRRAAGRQPDATGHGPNALEHPRPSSP